MLNGEDLQRPTYTCLRTIGEGAVGICRKGRHEVFGKDIVQKTVSLLGVPDGVAREPRLLEQIQHDHIISVREAQWDPDPSLASIMAVTFVCPYYPGGSVLDAFRDDHVFETDVVMEMARNILDALAYLHTRQRYLHRDVKPGNILLDSGRVGGCLSDLGSAARLEADGTTQNNGGTPLYLDPYARVSGRMTVQSDLYGLGVTMAEMLRGRFPYEDVNDSVIDMRLAEGKRAMADRWFTLPPEVPVRAARFIRSLSNPDPERRPRSAEVALQALNRLDYMFWKREFGDGLYGAWTARWPRSGFGTSKAREFRIEVARVDSGKSAGSTRVLVSKRRSGGSWRRINELGGYVTTGSREEVARHFRAAERFAQE